MSSLEGRVTDDTGSPLPGVTVELQGPPLPSPRVVVDGRRRPVPIEELPSGTYRVAYRLLGFVGVVREAVVVDSPARRRRRMRRCASP